MTPNLPRVAGEDEITVNGSLPRRPFTYRGREPTAGWVFEGPRALTRSTSAGQKEAFCRCP